MLLFSWVPAHGRSGTIFGKNAILEKKLLTGISFDNGVFVAKRISSTVRSTTAKTEHIFREKNFQNIL